ncbi:hypothetical protein JD505_05020 [Aeromonas hydrophila]|uniref:hypothetical protein n=1 Tax=Aeromonas hydrophila TaxID=644 RepID=UPI00191D95AE|nr:hypothetical protein [Aeromonas hydrophila]MBL0568643.1 hypothetical protein [Aeromonas hydrophila]
MEDILKVIGALASLFAIYKVVVDVVLARSSRRRDEYKFTKEYISDLQGGSEHLYVLEKGFFALTGKIYPISEINVLLSQKSPSVSLSLRSDSGSFVQFDDESQKYIWKGKYKNKYIRKYAGKLFFFLYLITASLAIGPIYLKGIYIFSSFSITAFSLSLFIVAISCLVQNVNLDSSKRFMNGLVYSAPNKLRKQSTTNISVDSNNEIYDRACS